MNINKVETQVLIGKKVNSEHKTYETAYEEINRDKLAIRELNDKIKFKERELWLVEKKVENKKKEFDKAFNETKKLEDNQVKLKNPVKETFNRNSLTANSLQIRRVLHYLDEHPNTCADALARELGYKKEIVRDAFHTIEIINKRNKQ